MKRFSDLMSEAITFRAEQLYPKVKNLSADDLVIVLDKILSGEYPSVPRSVSGLRFVDSLVSIFVRDGKYDLIKSMKYSDVLEMHPDRLTSLKNHAKDIKRIHENTCKDSF